MKIVIVGAGALGGLVGAQLAAGGEDVTFIEINEARYPADKVRGDARRASEYDD